jgi:endoglucanase
MNQMFIKLSIAVCMVIFSQNAISQLVLDEIRTASDHVLVAYFRGPDLHALDRDISKWTLNSLEPVSINFWITPKWDDVELSYEHHVYLSFEESFSQGETYVLKTPHASAQFVFDDSKVFCESIKTNQAGYSALSDERYANLAIWLGDGGGKRIDKPLPAYRVIESISGLAIAAGMLVDLGYNQNSNDYIYRIDLSEVPEGGPYTIIVEGYGRSHPFGVGGVFADRLAYIAFRGLLYERCGMEQKQPYFEHDVRGSCHTRVYVTDSEPREAKVTFSDSDPIMEIYGGYHDAGDCDRRDHHMMAPMFLLCMYDAFPEYFSDLQYNIPDMFDEHFTPTGKGNGIPDIIDEAEWGTIVWEYLQEESGGVRSGVERNGYPANGPTVDHDTVPYGTFRVSANSTNLAAGLFAHLARALKPYDPDRSMELQRRAEQAWAFAGASARPGHKLYFYTQYYLLTGDKETHNLLKEIAPVARELRYRHEDNPRSIHRGEIILGTHFFSYLVNQEREKDSLIVGIFEESIRETADIRIRQLHENPYPNGTADPNRWWGSQTAQGQMAESCIMQWRLTGEQEYINAASCLMDYNMGLNPVGKCYLTGIGFDRTMDPLHHDSYPGLTKGWGPTPGLLVFGPGNLRQINSGAIPMYPEIHSLSRQRQFIDHRRYVSVTEFTIPESLTFPSVIYTILAGGGSYDGSTDPFDIQGAWLEGMSFDLLPVE